MSNLFVDARSLSKQKKSMLSEMLDSIFDNLDLTQTQRECIESAYKAVGEYLASCEDPLLEKAQIYPQGSIRVKTTNKPLLQEEYDVDLILFLPNAGLASREEIINVVKRHLLDSDRYKGLVVDLPRGLRINYKGDYHLDITPAKKYDQATLPGHALWVVDKSNGFKESNPEGMAQVFDKSCLSLPKILGQKRFLEGLTNKSISDLPDQNQKKPLNRIVQILKRHRDIWAQRDNNRHANYKPISVVLTSLARRAYDETIESNRTYNNDFDLLLDVIELMPHHIEMIGEQILIANPTMLQENYAEKWNRLERQEGGKFREAFFVWHRAAVETFEQLAREDSKGLDNVFEALSGAFGESPVSAAKDKIIEAVSNTRSEGKLGISLGRGGITAAKDLSERTSSLVSENVVTVKRNNFYGE